MSDTLGALSETRQKILAWVKAAGGATTSDVAARLGITDEGARQHLVYLERHGWVKRRPHPTGGRRSGRPTTQYAITPDGDAFFPKKYDHLAVALIDTVIEQHGTSALRELLTTIVDRQVEAWEPQLSGLSVAERAEALRNFYIEGDPFTSVEHNGGIRLVERNCPFRAVAMERPPLCSTTVSTLTRLLGVRVERTCSFQSGDGCCVFDVHPDEPVDRSFRFAFEDEMGGPGGGTA